jgi:hypothetical protein
MTNGDPRRPDTRTLDSETIHLLNNHLGVILGFVNLLLDDTPEEDPRRRDLMEIKEAALSAVTLLGPAYRRKMRAMNETEGA